MIASHGDLYIFFLLLISRTNLVVLLFFYDHFLFLLLQLLNQFDTHRFTLDTRTHTDTRARVRLRKCLAKNCNDFPIVFQFVSILRGAKSLFRFTKIGELKKKHSQITLSPPKIINFILGKSRCWKDVDYMKLRVGLL